MWSALHSPSLEPFGVLTGVTFWGCIRGLGAFLFVRSLLFI